MRNEKTIDALDRAIIAELSRNARLTNLELARRVGLTAAPCLRRVQRLEAAGVIRGYTALLDRKAVGQGFEVIVSVDIAVNDGRTVEDFEAAVAALPDVVEVRRMFGQPDYFLRVLVPDPEHYESQTIRKLSLLPAVSRFVSHQTMRLVKG